MSQQCSLHHGPRPRRCPRCGGPMVAFSLSFFNTEEVCMDCKEDERHAPGFAAARAAEEAAARGGNYNFPGVGLSAADDAFLAERRAARRKPASGEKEEADG